MRYGSDRWAMLGMMLFGAITFLCAADYIWQSPRRKPPEQMRLALPPVFEVLAFGGDRFFASNVGIFRVWTLDTEVRDRTSIQTLAQLHRNIAILNPWNTDNYYHANALLPSEGEVEAAQFVLSQATQARYWDEWPPYFYALNQAHDLRDPVGADAFIRMADERAIGPNRERYRSLRASWLERGSNLRESMQALLDMYNSERNENLKRILAARALRVNGLLILQDATEQYTKRYGSTPKSLSDLLMSGIIKEIPRDPFDIGYGLDESGKPILLKRKDK